jgi:hypothetical protein
MQAELNRMFVHKVRVQPFTMQGGTIMASNGTSFSCPVMAGGAVCLRQALPTVSNFVIMDAIRKSAHLFKHPTNQYRLRYSGFGSSLFSD